MPQALNYILSLTAQIQIDGVAEKEPFANKSNLFEKLSRRADTSEENNVEKLEYNERIQPKYYLKYTKSSKKSMESDFNLNDDYIYKAEDARQFYIRREILRSIVSHTCTDIYNIKNTTFSSLLYLCDEMQEWGRKSWNDLYTNVNPDAISLFIEEFDSESIEYKETVNMKGIKDKELIVDNIAKLYTRQFEVYQLVFRDGQDEK